MDYHSRIIIDPKIMVGKPVIKGTRITVELILRRLAGGTSLEEIVRDYPHLKRGDVTAAMEYAREIVEEQQVYPLSPLRYGKKAKALA